MKCVSRSYWWLSRILLTLASLMAAPQAEGINADVYAHPARWQDEGGRTITLAELRGKKSVFALFYASCKTICPMTIKSLQEMEAKLGGDVQFVLITIDPADNGPEGRANLREFIKMQKISPKWKILASDTGNTRNLAAALGLGYADKPANGNLHNMHSLAIAVVRPNGSVAGQQPLATWNLSQLKNWLVGRYDSK